MDKRIKLMAGPDSIPAETINACGGSRIMAAVFYNRGYKEPKIIKQMLDTSLYSPISPFELPGMEDVVERVKRAINNNEKICVYGDYDVDGITATVVLVQFLKRFSPNIEYHVPDRFSEGYGMNCEVVRRLNKNGVSLIITCDCGISDTEEIRLARELGMDVVVTDHHTIPKDLPPADAIVNPGFLPEFHRAARLSGCAVAWYFCKALAERIFIGVENNNNDNVYCYTNEKRFIEDSLSDMLAISIIADVVRLDGENRYLLKKFLPILFNSKRPGLMELFKIINIRASLKNEEDIAFQLAPRINAAGRMDSADLAVRLFLSDDPAEASELAKRIDELNVERRKIQQAIIREAMEQAEKLQDKKILVLFKEDWHHGVTGIAAGKISEVFGKPAILLSLKEDNQTVVGSARSVEGVNIYSLVFECSESLISWGGHEGAAGLSLHRENLEAFKRNIEQKALEIILPDTEGLIRADLELAFNEIDMTMIGDIAAAGPYGEGFAPPLFATSGVEVSNDRITEANHHIMTLKDREDTAISAVMWSGDPRSLQDGIYDIVYTTGINSFRGNDRLQLSIRHMFRTKVVTRVPFRGKITDRRGALPDKIYPDYTKALFYHESRPEQSFAGRKLDLKHPEKNDVLVLLSVPYSLSQLKEITGMVNPLELVLCFSYGPGMAELEKYGYSGAALEESLAFIEYLNTASVEKIASFIDNNKNS